jgi:hypothetical protein
VRRDNSGGPEMSMARGSEMSRVRGPDGLRSRNVDIHLGRPIKGDAWHLIQEIAISRLGGLSMEHNVSSRNAKL